MMAENNGLYILADDRLPGATMPIVTNGAQLSLAGAHGNKPGVISQPMEWAPLSQDIDLWHPATHYAGGPYSVGLCSAEAATIKFWKSAALRSMPALLFFRDAMAAKGRGDAAAAAQTILDSIDKVENQTTVKT